MNNMKLVESKVVLSVNSFWSLKYTKPKTITLSAKTNDRHHLFLNTHSHLHR